MEPHGLAHGRCQQAYCQPYKVRTIMMMSIFLVTGLVTVVWLFIALWRA